MLAACMPISTIRDRHSLYRRFPHSPTCKFRNRQYLNCQLRRQINKDCRVEQNDRWARQDCWSARPSTCNVAIHSNHRINDIFTAESLLPHSGTKYTLEVA